MLPPSGRFTAGISLQNLDVYWGLTNLTGLKKFIVDLMSNSVLINVIITGDWKVFWDSLKHLILPAVAVGTIPMSIIARMTRSSLLEVLGLDYIRTARAKGLVGEQGHQQARLAQRTDPDRYHYRHRNRQACSPGRC